MPQGGLLTSCQLRQSLDITQVWYAHKDIQSFYMRLSNNGGVLTLRPRCVLHWAPQSSHLCTCFAAQCVANSVDEPNFSLHIEQNGWNWKPNNTQWPVLSSTVNNVVQQLKLYLTGALLYIVDQAYNTYTRKIESMNGLRFVQGYDQFNKVNNTQVWIWLLYRPTTVWFTIYRSCFSIQNVGLRLLRTVVQRRSTFKWLVCTNHMQKHCRLFTEDLQPQVILTGEVYHQYVN